jgi:hypothetical protein
MTAQAQVGDLEIRLLRMFAAVDAYRSMGKAAVRSRHDTAGHESANATTREDAWPKVAYEGQKRNCFDHLRRVARQAGQ